MLARRPISTINNKARNIKPQRATRAELTGEVTAGKVAAFLHTQLERLYGHVDDIDLTLGWDQKKQMMRDAYVSAAIITLCLGAVARTGEIKPADSNLFRNDDDEEMAEEIAAFCRRNFVYLSQRHRDYELTLFNQLKWALVIGHSKAEIVLQLETEGVDKGKYTLKRIKGKSRTTTSFLVDRQMNVVGVAAFTGQFAAWQEFNQKREKENISLMDATALPAGWEDTGREKWLIITNAPDDDDSPLGYSECRPAFAPYKMKRNNWAYYLKALDFTALPFTYVELPLNAPKMLPFKDDGTVDENADKVNAATAVYQATVIGRQGGVAVYPNGTKVNALHNAASGDPHASANSLFNSEITQAILLQGLATGTDKHMARAAGQVHQDILDLKMRMVRRYGTGSTKRDVLGLLVRKNYPARYHHLIPSYSLGEVELNDFNAWALAFAKLAEAGLLHYTQFSAVWAVLGLPQADMDKFLEEIEANQKLIREMGQPEVAKDGTVGPSQIKKYTTQESGKTITRRASRQIAGQSQSTFSQTSEPITT